jgi:formate hydrogenlyase subunit 3/multisubunit Na+/H+ antiporter MnhD subunit
LLIWTIAIYIVILLLVWGFYAVARMHTMKFKNFSTHITPITNFLMLFLIILSITWFILIFSINWEDSTYQISTENKIEEKVEEEKNYEQEIIGNDYY